MHLGFHIFNPLTLVHLSNVFRCLRLKLSVKKKRSEKETLTIYTPPFLCSALSKSATWQNFYFFIDAFSIYSH